MNGMRWDAASRSSFYKYISTNGTWMFLYFDLFWKTLLKAEIDQLIGFCWESVCVRVCEDRYDKLTCDPLCVVHWIVALIWLYLSISDVSWNTDMWEMDWEASLVVFCWDLKQQGWIFVYFVKLKQGGLLSWISSYCTNALASLL